jgi:hypothetical protein
MEMKTTLKQNLIAAAVAATNTHAQTVETRSGKLGFVGRPAT